MHEFGYGEAILEQVLARANGRPLARVRVRAGASHALVPDALQQAFTMKAVGTPAEGAEIDLVVIPVPLLCAACGAEADGRDHVDARGRPCDACDEGWLQPLGHGDELVLESLEYRSL